MHGVGRCIHKPYDRMPSAKIFGDIAGAFREFNASRRRRNLEKLLASSKESESKLEAEAKRFGIELRRPKTGNYYAILGIKYNADISAIKEAYHGLVKKYHPDVSKEAGAEERTKKINEAYAVLRDSKLREEYDRSSFKGESYIGADAAKCISRELFRIYSDARAKDFDEFKDITSVPLRRDVLASAIEDVCNWNWRFDKVERATFGNFKSYGKRIKKLSAINRNMLKSEKEEAAIAKLVENGKMLDELVQVWDKVEKGISVVTKKVREDIGRQENAVAKKLRSFV